jgi:hypothetical protein
MMMGDIIYEIVYIVVYYQNLSIFTHFRKELRIDRVHFLRLWLLTRAKIAKIIRITIITIAISFIVFGNIIQ